MGDKETEEMLVDTLQVEVFRAAIGQKSLVGSHTWVTNKGALLSASTPRQDVEELSQLLDLPMAAGTINRGSDVVGAGVIANDWAAFCGSATTSAEIGVVESVLGLRALANAVGPVALV